MRGVLQGHPRLVKALSDTFSPMYGRTIDPNEEVLISVGAYGALFSAVQGLVNPGDEVLCNCQHVLLYNCNKHFYG
jgi:aspartate/methionine/tyrosine aminotransferase